MGFNEFLSKLFGNKATRDMKEIVPWVEKVKAAYPDINKLSNDELRAKTKELQTARRGLFCRLAPLAKAVILPRSRVRRMMRLS